MDRISEIQFATALVELDDLYLHHYGYRGPLMFQPPKQTDEFIPSQLSAETAEGIELVVESYNSLKKIYDAYEQTLNGLVQYVADNLVPVTETKTTVERRPRTLLEKAKAVMGQKYHTEKNSYHGDIDKNWRDDTTVREEIDRLKSIFDNGRTAANEFMQRYESCSSPEVNRYVDIEIPNSFLNAPANIFYDK